MCPLQVRACATVLAEKLPLLYDGCNITPGDIDPSKRFVVGRSWLQPGLSPSGKFGLGCIACADGSAPSDKGGRKLKMFECNSFHGVDLYNMKRHAEADWHKINVHRYLGVKLGPSSKPISQAPPAEHFGKVLDKVLEGGKAHSGCKGVGDEKNPKNDFCSRRGHAHDRQEFFASCSPHLLETR